MKRQSNRTRRPKAAIGIAVAAIAAGIIWKLTRAETAPVVATAAVTVGDVESTVLASGTLEASRIVSVGAQVSGQIKSLKVELGDRVEAGDPIAEIDATTQENELRDARAALASVKAQRNEQAASLKQTELAFQRQRFMLDDEATSRADYESAEAALNSARARIAALDAQIDQSTAKIDTAQANLGYTKIRAPMGGTVVAIVAKEGQTVNAIQSAPTIVKLADLDSMTVNAKISEADVVRVRPGQTVYFTILGDPQKRYYGKLRSVEPAPTSIEAETSAAQSSTTASSSNAIYYNGLFEVPNESGDLRISMTAQVSIVLGEAKKVLTIPSGALGTRDSDGNRLVTVVSENGRTTPRRVTIGLNNNAVAQVTSGLAEGEKVVVGEAVENASGRVRDGAGMF